MDAGGGMEAHQESDAESNVTEESNPPADVDFHGLADLWNEMTAGLEASMDMGQPSSNEHVIKDVEECDHTFIFKDDIGYFCRVCGIIKRSIESIIEFKIPKLQGSPIDLSGQHL
uniref:protein CHROMATIN REMODELING 35-like isoform X2 n=1 Tax=Erigeron canadensis TaxID=72917 RepID=UPI001CB914F9|nr:protein CHROMATIN REMODELING 35-like isoform X2 [Erigeron canadensis]